LRRFLAARVWVAWQETQGVCLTAHTTGQTFGQQILGVNAATAELVSISFRNEGPVCFLKGQEPPQPARALQWANVDSLVGNP
jgi:hypothetical protein